MNEPKFYRCAHCGNLVGLIEDHGVPMLCCGGPMQRLEPNTAEASHDRHLPFVEIGGDTVTVQVGIEPHEMTQEHHIAWAYLQTVKGGQRKRFIVGEDEVPVAEFKLTDDLPVAAYAYCSRHGLWKTGI